MPLSAMFWTIEANAASVRLCRMLSHLSFPGARILPTRYVAKLDVIAGARG